jgi:hypothetical protein
MNYSQLPKLIQTVSAKHNANDSHEHENLARKFREIAVENSGPQIFKELSKPD